MSKQPYVLVLAQTSHEGAKYVRRAGLPRGRWRIVARASSIQGIRQADVHCLPGFHGRPDRHAILGVLRYANCTWYDVEMPLTDDEMLAQELAAVQAEEAKYPDTLYVDADHAHTIALRYNRLLDSNALETAAATEPVEAPKQKRRRKCAECGALHFKDEPCVRTDGVEETPDTAKQPVSFDF